MSSKRKRPGSPRGFTTCLSTNFGQDEARQNRRAILLRIFVAAALVSAVGFAYWEYNLNSSLSLQLYLSEQGQSLIKQIEEAFRNADPRPAPDADQQKARAESLDKEGDTGRRRGDLKAALELYKQEGELRREFLASDDESRRELALTLNKIGGVERQLGNLDNALKSYDRVREIRESLRQGRRLSTRAVADAQQAWRGVGGQGGGSIWTRRLTPIPPRATSERSWHIGTR